MKCATCGIYFCWLCNKDITIEGACLIFLALPSYLAKCPSPCPVLDDAPLCPSALVLRGVGYDHFNTGEKCVLFEAEEIQRWNHANRNVSRRQSSFSCVLSTFRSYISPPVFQIHMEIGRIVRQQQAQQEVRIVRCGSCNAQNVVLDQNNHLHCWYAPFESRRWPGNRHKQQ